MTLHKSRLQRHTRDRKQERKFLLVIVGITLLLMVILYYLFA